MDSTLARCFSILKACAATANPRSRPDPTLTDSLAVFINLYNGMSDRPVALRPTTQAQRDSMFYMCLDTVLAVLNVQPGPISGVYTQNLQTIAALASESVPYTIEAFAVITRIRSACDTWTPTRERTHPYVNTPLVCVGGVWFDPAPRQVLTTYTSMSSFEVSIVAGGQTNLADALLPHDPDTIAVYFVWQPYSVAQDRTGATHAMPAGMLVNVNNVAIPPGRVSVWSPGATVTLENPTQQRGLVRFEVIKFLVMGRGIDSFPNEAASIASTLQYRDETWHTLRTTILALKGYPTKLPPVHPPITREEMFTYLLVGALGDVYSALRPSAFLNDAMPLAPGLNARQHVRNLLRN
uniref:Core protein VP7 n=1 Tax=Ninarumi virus TaxID=2108521 RepID=A0A2P1K563_9REOV|nr:VP7 [Ninarumi virus]